MFSTFIQTYAQDFCFVVTLSQFFFHMLSSVRNGIPGKEGLFIISVTSGSLADKTGARVSHSVFV